MIDSVFNLSMQLSIAGRRYKWLGGFALVACALLLPGVGFGATLAPATFDFGAQSMGTSSPAQNFVFTNNTGASITVSSISVAAQFSQTNNCPATLGSGATCTINVTFNPSIAAGALLSTTNVAGSLTIVSTAAGSPTTASLAGVAEKSLVTHYYRSILRRAPDAGGKTFWESEATRLSGLGANVNETWFAMATFFYFSPEYTAFGRNDTDFVIDLYNTFFNRLPDAGGLTFWTGQIAAGVPREIILVSFMFSTEFQTFAQGIFGNTAARKEVDTVVDFYRGVLSRLPDTSGFNFWVQQFRTAQCTGAAAVNTQVESISSNFMNGAEYIGRNRTNAQFVGDLYNSFLRRGGDQGGVLFWIAQLNGGATRNSIRQQFIASPEFQGRVAAIVGEGCLGKSYFVSTTGNDANNGLSLATAFRTIGKAWGVIQSSDRLIVADGSYTGASPPAGKSGTANGVIVVQSLNPGGAQLAPVSFRGNAYMAFVGFRINGAAPAVSIVSNGVGKPSHHLTFQQIGFSCTPNTLTDESCFDLSDGTHHLLLEDSWGWGGGRYTILCYGGPGGSPPNVTCDNNTFRRLVLRQGPTTSGPGKPQAAINMYYGSSNLIENVIAIDGNASSDSSNSAFYVTAHVPPPNSNFNRLFGLIALKNLGYGLFLDCGGAICDGLEVRDSVFWASASGGIAISAGPAPDESCRNAVINRNTVGKSGGAGYDNYGCDNATLTNNVFFQNSGFGALQSPSAGSTTTNHHNGYFQNTSGARQNLSPGAGDLTSNPGLLYITRIEAGSPYKNSGASGDIGASVIGRYVDGQLTAQPLWPWPFEDRLRSEMCASVTTGFCATGKSLTRYVWEYLGNAIPPGIYAP
jgi:hypothetical protein